MKKSQCLASRKSSESGLGVNDEKTEMLHTGALNVPNFPPFFGGTASPLKNPALGNTTIEIKLLFSLLAFFRIRLAKQ